MARQPRPGRTLLVFLAMVGLMFGLVALAGTWKPRLGLDLQGGTRITLVTVGETTPDSLAQAADIIDQRVNGSGVSESEVTTQGDSIIVVEIPGKSRRDLEETVKRQAQMRFRLVALTDNGAGTAGQTPTTPTEPAPVDPGTGVLAPSDGPSDGPSDVPSDVPSDDAEPNQRPTLNLAEDDETAPVIEDPLAWAKNPDADSVAAYEAFACPPPGEIPVVEDVADRPLVTCDDQGVKYLLSPAMIEGTDLRSADAGLVDFGYVVNIAFKGDATDTFTKISQDLVGTERQFAIVLDGTVISAPTMEGVITDGRAQISGNFTEATAQSLATSLKFGALPVAFNKDINVQTVGATLAGNQLSAGLWAGALGLALVMFYCLLYYRGLGLVVIGSLFVAAALTYALVLLLSESAGFALTLPGVAGLIVAVGITADSFVVFFERIRDEMRDGKSMRIAVETGWVRARNTCLAADAVSLLAAVVLFIFAAGVVKGFAFALGISTLIDLVVFFWFTKPMVSWLATYSFFNRGHRLSGLSAETLGVDSINLVGTAGGRA